MKGAIKRKWKSGAKIETRVVKRNRFYSPELLHKLIYMSERRKCKVAIQYALPTQSLFLATSFIEIQVNVFALFQQMYYANNHS